MVELSCQEPLQAWRCSNKPWPIGPSWNRPGRGDPRPTLTQNFASCTGTFPRTTPNTIEGSAQALKSLIHTPILRRNGFIHTRSGSILMRISLATRGTTTDSLALFSVRMESIIMGRRFVEGKAEHLQERIVMEGQFLERGAARPRRRIMGRPIMAVQRPQNASFHSNEPVKFLRRRRR